MGTDIHMIAEVRENGIWRAIDKAVFPNPSFNPKPSYDWEIAQFQISPYEERNYSLFGLLSGERSDLFDPIAPRRGFPEDISDNAFSVEDEYGSILYPPAYGYGASYLSLAELKNYPWKKRMTESFFVSESEYRNYLFLGTKMNIVFDVDQSIEDKENPVYLSPAEMEDLIRGERDRQINTKYYTSGEKDLACSYDDCIFFVDQVIPALEALVPNFGTEDDVRIIFDFDS